MTGISITYEEYIQLPETQDAREEVVNGEICITPPAAFEHAELIENLTRELHAVLDRKQFRLVASSFGIVISRTPLRVRNPDLAVFRRSALVVADGLVHTAPEFVVEVLPPSNTRGEMSAKLKDYCDLGIGEVWLISREARTVEALLLRDGSYRQAKLLSSGKLAPATLPEAAIDIGRIFE